MKSKQIFVLGLILIVLVCAVVIKQTRKPAELSTQEYLSLDLSFDTVQVEKIEILKPKSAAVVLTKTNQVWQVESFFKAKGDQEKIDHFLKEIKGASGEVRGRDKALFADFGIEGDKALQVKLSGAGGNLLDLRIGTHKGNSDSVFVRKEGSELVYLTNANLLREIGVFGDPASENPASDYWAVTSLAKVDAAQVQKLETHRYANGKEMIAANLALEADAADPSKKKWKYLRMDIPFAPDAEKIKQFLTSIAGWHAQKVLDPAAKDYGFSNSKWKMVLGMEGGKELVITAGAFDESSKSYFMQVTGAPVVFQLSQYYLENMDVDDSKFFVDNPLDLNPDKTEKLVVRAEKKEMRSNPKQKKWDALTNYLNDLKTFHVDKLLFDAADEKKVHSPATYSVEIQKEGEPSKFLDVGETLSANPKEPKTYAARLRGNTRPFAISEDSFKKLFDNLDRLAEPTVEPKK